MWMACSRASDRYSIVTGGIVIIARVRLVYDTLRCLVGWSWSFVP